METNRRNKSPIQVICDQALAESSVPYRGKKVKGRITENTGAAPIMQFQCVSMTDRPISLENFCNFDPDVRSTKGWFTITYMPENCYQRTRKDRPFKIGQDLIRMRLTFSGYKHWKMYAHEIPELAWIDRWCPSLTKELFDLAAQHPGRYFSFCPDWISYGNMIRYKAEKAGINIDNRPFVCYAPPKYLEDQINEKYKLAPLRTTFDVEEIVNKIELQNNGGNEDGE